MAMHANLANLQVSVGSGLPLFLSFPFSLTYSSNEDFVVLIVDDVGFVPFLLVLVVEEE